jgi:hypothetical protein
MLVVLQAVSRIQQIGKAMTHAVIRGELLKKKILEFRFQSEF